MSIESLIAPLADRLGLMPTDEAELAAIVREAIRAGIESRMKTVKRDDAWRDNVRRGPIDFVRQLRSEADVVEALSVVEGTIENIKGQLAQAYDDFKRTGVPSDPAWRSKARTALSHLEIKKGALSSRLGTIRRMNRKAQEGITRGERKDLERKTAFVQAASRILPDDQFKAIWDEADRASTGATHEPAMEAAE